MQIQIQKTSQSRISEVDFTNLPFGKIFTDHMYICDYDNGQWQTPQIVPFGDISFSPALSAIHYGQSLFEGMKAHKDKDGNAFLFRPLDNWERMNLSAYRMCMPEVPQDIFMEGLKALVNLDKDWIPTIEGSSLYIRPFLFATDECVGVRPSDKYRFMIICCPVNAFYAKALKVKVEDVYVRAVEGGTGEAKSAGNYGGSMLPTKLANQQGFDQIIWLDGRERKYIEESGTMNLFFVSEGKLLTPSLSGSILHGYTRASILQLAKDNGVEIDERRITIDEIIELHKSGKLQEGFGAGTAATIVQILSFDYLGNHYELLPVEERKVSLKLVKLLNDIKSFQSADPYGWMYKI